MKKIVTENNLGVLVEDDNIAEHIKGINTLINNFSKIIITNFINLIFGIFRI